MQASAVVEAVAEPKVAAETAVEMTAAKARVARVAAKAVVEMTWLW